MLLTEMLQFWEETRKKKDLSHIMVTLKGRFKGETGEKLHMFPLVEITELVIEVRKWVGRWLEVLVKQDGRLEGLVFQIEEGERLMVLDLNEGFQEGLREVAGWRRGIDTGMCGHWRGHEFAEINEEVIHHIGAEQGT